MVRGEPQYALIQYRIYACIAAGILSASYLSFACFQEWHGGKFLHSARLDSTSTEEHTAIWVPCAVLTAEHSTAQVACPRH